MNIREYLDSYNISEECKQSILELFDRPSLGRTLWDIGGGNSLTKAIKDKFGSSKKKKEVKSEPETPKEPTRKEKVRDYLNKKDKYNRLKSTLDKSIKKHDKNVDELNKFSNTDTEDKLNDDTKDKLNDDTNKHDNIEARDSSDKIIAQVNAEKSKERLIDVKNREIAAKSEISKARKELFPKSPARTGQLPNYKKGTGRYKEVKEAFEAFDNSLLELNSLFEDIGTAISGMMDTQPITLAGKEQPSAHKQKKAQLNYKYQKLHRKQV